MTQLHVVQDHRMEFIVGHEVYTSIRLAAMIANKTVSQWIRDIIVPVAEKEAEEFITWRNKKGYE